MTDDGQITIALANFYVRGIWANVVKMINIRKLNRFGLINCTYFGQQTIMYFESNCVFDSQPVAFVSKPFKNPKRQFPQKFKVL